MSVDGDPMQSLGALSVDTTANINEDITWISENLEGSRKKATELVFSNFRGSIDGGSTIMNAFNILKQGINDEDQHNSALFSPLGPNSIFELTVASDAARVRLSRGLKHQVTLNGGATTIYNLTKPTNKDIPQIQLHLLRKKVPNAKLTEELIANVAGEYKSFELSYKSLTEESLLKLSEQEHPKHGSDWDDSDAEEREAIPLIFADEDFRLDDPRVFRQVMENSQVFPDPESNQSTHLIHNTEVQEKISRYLDQVEVELIREISKTSDSFFSTLDDIQTIKDQSKDCLDQFHGVMTKVNELEDGQAKAGLRILDLLDERKNIDNLECTVHQIQTVITLFAKARELHTKGMNSECLNQIVVIENLILGTEREDYTDPDTYEQYPNFAYPLVPLTQLPALKGLMRDLHDLKHTCSQGYITNFVDLLLHNLRNHYTSTPTRDTLNRIYVSIDRSRKYIDQPVNRQFNEIDPELRTNLQVFISNLAKSGHLVQAFEEYQDKIIAEVKTIIRTGLPTAKESFTLESGSGTNSRAPSFPPTSESTPMAGGGTLSENIRALSAAEFNAMMSEIYANLSECLRRLTVHQKLLLDLSLTSLSPAASQQIDVMGLDITTAINKAIELTQIRLVKVLNVRLEQLGDLSVGEYLQLYLISSAYLLECEFINPGFVATGPGSSLTEWVRNHVAYFLHKFHSNSIKKLATLCDKETWRECTSHEEISAAQHIVDDLQGYAKFIDTDGKEGFDGKRWTDLLDFYDLGQDQSETDVTEPDHHDVIPRLVVSDVGYLVPPMVTKIVENARDYVIISRIFTLRACNVKSNLLTYFKVVNSRISQAILNAGATRTAGLKHITTKHLALCIQTIEFHAAFLELIQSIFKNTPATGEAAETEDQTFTNTISHYKDHEKELFSKLVSIMHDRTLSHCAAVTKLDLSQPIKHPQQCHPYMETLIKETSTVAKVLGKYLQDKDCSYILLQVFDNYKRLLVGCFCAELPQLKDFNEKHSLLKDIDYFRVKLSETPGYGNSGQIIWENVNSLPTIEDARMEQIMRNNIEVERAAAVESAKNSAKTSARNSIEVKVEKELPKPEESEQAQQEDKPPTPEKELPSVDVELEKELPQVEKELPHPKVEGQPQETENELPGLQGDTSSKEQVDSDHKDDQDQIIETITSDLKELTLEDQSGQHINTDEPLEVNKFVNGDAIGVSGKLDDVHEIDEAHTSEQNGSLEDENFEADGADQINSSSSLNEESTTQPNETQEHDDHEKQKSEVDTEKSQESSNFTEDLT